MALRLVGLLGPRAHRRKCVVILVCRGGTLTAHDIFTYHTKATPHLCRLLASAGAGWSSGDLRKRFAVYHPHCWCEVHRAWVVSIRGRRCGAWESTKDELCIGCRGADESPLCEHRFGAPRAQGSRPCRRRGSGDSRVATKCVLTPCLHRRPVPVSIGMRFRRTHLLSSLRCPSPLFPLLPINLCSLCPCRGPRPLRHHLPPGPSRGLHRHAGCPQEAGGGQASRCGRCKGSGCGRGAAAGGVADP